MDDKHVCLRFVEAKLERGQRSGIDKIKYHTLPRIPHRKVTKTQLDITNESQGVDHFPADLMSGSREGGRGYRPPLGNHKCYKCP